ANPAIPVLVSPAVVRPDRSRGRLISHRLWDFSAARVRHIIALNRVGVVDVERPPGPLTAEWRCPPIQWWPHVGAPSWRTERITNHDRAIRSYGRQTFSGPPWHHRSVHRLDSRFCEPRPRTRHQHWREQPLDTRVVSRVVSRRCFYGVRVA